MTNYNQINKNHTILLFLLSLFFLILNIDTQVSSLTIICFFLIATIGVSHGSLDHIKGAKLLKIFKIKNKLLFYLIYIFISLLIVCAWMLLPSFTLTIFLIVASYHFGKEDSVFGKIKRFKLSNLFLFLKGSLVVSAPLCFHASETIQIFEILNVEFNQYDNNILVALIFLGLISNFFINKNIFLSLLDSLTIIILNINFEPLLAFTIYFCFLHSVRHSISLAVSINNKNFKKGLTSFLAKALPLTLITALAFLIAVFFLNKYYLLNSAILKVIFIGLASLTFPHILLEYLLEKNEK
ncbi:Brp/Blh family beta-carotene 15,15'-dioxygenase [Pelagibacteraceae bacterium]|nr:Brp/Blh family beta-carotene 15,15'-dioxygenase [Pelagibacteraceae bacterium]